MASKTKSMILERHRANSDLNTALPAQIAMNDKDLAADEAQSPLDERIITAAAEALESGQTHYVDVPGIAPLREAVAEHLNSSAGASYQSSNVIVTAGMQESRFLTIQKIGELYQSVAVPAVAHPGVRKALGTRARVQRTLKADPARGCLPTVETIAAAADKSRLFYLESPSRLSGAAYSAEECAAIHDIIRDSDSAVIWDGGLAAWVDGDCASLAALDSERERVAAIGEAWSGMGLASWFIAYIAAPENWLSSMQSQKQIMAICTSTASQYAALEAGQHYHEARQRQLERLSHIRADLLVGLGQAGIKALPGSAANIIALEVSNADKEQLRQAGFDYADGKTFGAPVVIRLNVGAATAQALAALS